MANYRNSCSRVAPLRHVPLPGRSHRCCHRHTNAGNHAVTERKRSTRKQHLLCN